MSFVDGQLRTPDKLDDLLALLRAQGLGQPTLGDVLAEHLSLTGLVCMWPGNITDASGQMMDIVGGGNHLTNNNNALFTNDSGGNLPYIDYNGTNQYHHHADTNPFRITGTETHIAGNKRGMTIGGWFYFDTLADYTGGMSKYGGPTLRSYTLRQGLAASNAAQFGISSDGTNQFFVNTPTNGISTGAWYSLIGRFTPSTEVAIFLNGDKYTNTTSIPASIYNSTSLFQIGASVTGGGGLQDGRVRFCFLCNAINDDEKIKNIYKAGKYLLGN